jgi:hypothetical protein
VVHRRATVKGRVTASLKDMANLKDTVRDTISRPRAMAQVITNRHKAMANPRDIVQGTVNQPRTSRRKGLRDMANLKDLAQDITSHPRATVNRRNTANSLPIEMG